MALRPSFTTGLPLSRNPVTIVAIIVRDPMSEGLRPDALRLTATSKKTWDMNRILSKKNPISFPNSHIPRVRRNR